MRTFKFLVLVVGLGIASSAQAMNDDRELTQQASCLARAQERFTSVMKISREYFDLQGQGAMYWTDKQEKAYIEQEKNAPSPSILVLAALVKSQEIVVDVWGAGCAMCELLYPLDVD